MVLTSSPRHEFPGTGYEDLGHSNRGVDHRHHKHSLYGIGWPLVAGAVMLVFDQQLGTALSLFAVVTLLVAASILVLRTS